MKRKVIILVSILFVVSLIGVGIWIFQSINSDKPQPADGASTLSDNAEEEAPTTDQNGDNEMQEETPYTAQRQTEDLKTYIIDNNPSLVDTSTNTPVFTIVENQNPLDNWYVLTLRNNQTDTSDANVVIHDIDGTLTTVAGPGTGLYTQANLPDAVKKALMKEAP